MTPKCWITWVLLSGLLWNLPASKGKQERNIDQELKECMKNQKEIFFFADTFDLFTIASNQTNVDCAPSGNQAACRKACILFMNKHATVNEISENPFPQMRKNGSSHLLLLSKWYIDPNRMVYLVSGRNCCSTISDFTASNPPESGPCRVRRAGKLCRDAVYNKTQCKGIASDKYIIDITAPNCHHCQTPSVKPEKESPIQNLTRTKDNKTDAAAASKTMEGMDAIAHDMKESSLTMTGEAVEGVILKIKEIKETEVVSIAYDSPKDSLSIISDCSFLPSFSRSVSVSKEAIDKALSANVSVPFLAVIRFTNLAKDEKNSTVLGDEVLGVEMGIVITNLTERIGINFRNMTYSGTPSCQSWNGEGDLPNWTDEGCWTEANGTNITCQCSHLTFFAILLAPPNETISSSDLKNLTIITKVGCGLSMFFLAIVLFMHFLIRRTKATDSTKILIHLVSSMFMLNLLFLINSSVADMNNSVGCKIVASLMHYFMLTTFTWFAVQALHLCLQMFRGGNIVINRYMLKVCLTSWVTPSVIVVVLLILGKYDEQVINTDDPAENVKMCWITDGNVHYIVNIGYYAIVFLFTFSTFTLMVAWLYILKRTKNDTKQVNKSGISLMTVMGLCCMLGVTWGFAFFAYGALRIPSYYIFTVLNSFQGFFLFIYYYKSRSNIATDTATSDNSSSNASRTTTIANDVLGLENPYSNMPEKQNPSEDD